MPQPIAAFDRLGTETAFEVLTKARALEAQGKDIVHLEIGEPDFDTPRHIVEAGVEDRHNLIAGDSKHLFYTGKH